MISPIRFQRRALTTVKKWCAMVAIMATASVGSAFTTNDAATIFNAFNAAFMSGGAYSGWWTHAELLEMAQDAYDNSPTTARRNIVTSTCNGFLSQNGSNWMYNEYNDDIAWAVIAFSRAHLITGNATYRNVAQSNFDGMFARGWDTNFFGGGIWWRQSDRQSKNACIQGPAAIAACYLYNITGDAGYLQKAQMIHAWNRAVLFNPSSGSVYDNIGTNGVVDTVALTYNQGTFIGSANFLYRATGLPGYYQDAILAGKRAQNGMTTAGVLPEWSSNTDLSGFNGIFARWMARFAKDQNLWSSFGPWLGTNANAAWSVRNTNDLAWMPCGSPRPPGSRPWRRPRNCPARPASI
jgi:predicted alpha-1,6-mannanase (GH76 family)